MKLPFLIFFVLTVFTHTFAGQVDTIQIESAAMRRSFKCVIITPDSYTLGTATKPNPKGRRATPNANVQPLRYPVVYLLHGYSDRYDGWVKKVPELPALADRLQQIIVCPDGNNSWYLDSPLDSTMRFETYVGREIPAYMDAHYRTLPDRRHRAIVGLSMGGHGALYLAIRHQDVFGQGGSLSGGVDMQPFAEKWDIKKWLGEKSIHPDNWAKNSVINVSDSLKKGDLRLYVDCGTEDFFLDVNRNLHAKLLARGIPHDYAERPGSHTWAYWRENLEYVLVYFRKGFEGKP